MVVASFEGCRGAASIGRRPPRHHGRFGKFPDGSATARAGDGRLRRAPRAPGELSRGACPPLPRVPAGGGVQRPLRELQLVAQPLPQRSERRPVAQARREHEMIRLRLGDA